MKYSKYLLSVIMFTIMLLAGCSSSDSGPEATTADMKRDVNELCSLLLNGNFFEDELSEVDSSYCEMLLGIADSEYANVTLYMGSGATAEQLVIFEAADTTQAESLLTKCSDYLLAQTDAYADYMPKEVDKLSRSAAAIYNDIYVVLCVADNSEDAATTISDFFK